MTGRTPPHSRRANKSTRRHRAHEDSLTTYLDAIREFPRIDEAEEIELARRIHANDAQARDRLVCANLRFVVCVAKRYQHLGVPLHDLINEGNIGLMRAARRFDETKGVKFISYAVWWIRQAIFRALATQARPVRIPLSGPARDATVGPIGGSRSLDATSGVASETVFGDVVADEQAAAPDEAVIETGLEDVTASALATLSARESLVVRGYFGFDQSEPLTLEAIGRTLGVTRERARQIKERALRRIRESPYASALATFRDG